MKTGDKVKVDGVTEPLIYLYTKHLGYYETIGEAITARNKYIIKNKLPIKLQFLMEN